MAFKKKQVGISDAEVLTTRTRHHWLDGLRGGAALAVILHHLIIETAIGRSFYSRVSIKYFDLGVFGVAIFFLISGYIIPQSTSRPSKIPVRRFLISRIFRLYPAYWLALGFACFLFEPKLSGIFWNITMFQRFFAKQDIVGVFWTLQVEIIFYGIMVLLIRFRLNRNPNSAVILLGIVGSIAILAAFVRYHYCLKAPLAPFLGITIMAIGYIIHWHASSRISSKKLIKYLAFGAFAICSSSLMGYSRDWGYNETPSRFIVSYFVSAVVFWGAMKYGAIFSTRILVFFGAISYSTYLLHQQIKILLAPFIGDWPWPLMIAINLASTTLLSWIVFTLLEQPMIKVGRFVSDKIEEREY